MYDERLDPATTDWHVIGNVGLIKGTDRNQLLDPDTGVTFVPISVGLQGHLWRGIPDSPAELEARPDVQLLIAMDARTAATLCDAIYATAAEQGQLTDLIYWQNRAAQIREEHTG